MSYLYVLDFPFKNFYKLAKQVETIRNYQKQVLVMIRETHKLTRYQSRLFSYISKLFFTEQTQKLTRTTSASR